MKPLYFHVVDIRTGKSVAFFEKQFHKVSRPRDSEAPRRFPKLTDAEFDALLAAEMKYPTASKRVLGARRVLTEHVTLTEASRTTGVTSQNIWNLVSRLEKRLAAEKEFE